MRKPRSLASPTIVFHISSHLASVSALPMTKSELFARVRATFIRRKSRKKPIEVSPGPERTVDRIMMSFSWP